MSTTVGKTWRKTRQEARLAKRAADDRAAGINATADAEAIIRSIPEIIAAAGDAESALVFGWVTFHDVAGDRRNKVDELSMRLHNELRTLRASDLAGRAAAVFAWCDANDLECFLVSVDIPLNENEYEFHVRPKSQ